MNSANEFLQPALSAPFRKRRSRLAGLVAAAMTLCAVPVVAHAADKILLLQWPNNGDPFGNISASAAASHMMNLGYTDVTFFDSAATSVPADVADYNEVYVISTGAMGTSDAAALVTYVQNGGHLYVTGDRPNPDNTAAATQFQEKILKLVLSNSSALQVGTGIDGGNGGPGQDAITLLSETTGVSSHPNALSTMYMDDPGLIGGVDTSHVFAVDATNRPVGAVWTHHDLLQGSGCVMLMMDVNWWNESALVTQPPPTNQDVENMIANVHDFMRFCGDHDLDGILDGDEAPLGTDPANPDSDGDGLCDGALAVNDASITQKCIAGENAESHQDTDGDGTIDALDTDDDNDGILTKDEVADVAMFGNPDSDDVPAWLDLDSDGDGVTDMAEGRVHFNASGVPDYLDPNYPNPQPSAATTAAAGGGAGPASNTVGGNSVTSASATGSGGADGGGDGGGCGCKVAESDQSSQTIAFGGLFAALAALWSRSSRRSRRAQSDSR